MKTDRVASAETIRGMHNEISDIVTGIACFIGTLSLKVKDGTKLYQVPPGCMAYMLQEHFKEELERLKEKQRITPVGVDKITEIL